MNLKLTFPAIFTALLFSLASNGQQKIKTLAGTGTGDFGGDGFAATDARLHSPQDVDLDGNGNLYVLDYLNVRIRKITTSGTILTVAGNGVIGNSGDGSISTSAAMRPTGMALDRSNLLFIADGHHAVLRKVNALGIISTVAGTGVWGNTGYGGPASMAPLGFMHGIAFDTANNLYITDARYHNVRKITAAGILERFAGNDTAGYMGDDGPATSARIDSPYAIAADQTGNVFISDLKYNVVRKVDHMSGIITTYAGNGSAGYSGDGGLAGAAQLNRPAGLAVDTAGNLFIADADNNVIRKVDATTGIITTVVGNGTPGFGGDLGYVNGCNLRTPFGVAVAKNGDLYIADANNQRIRQTYTPVGVADINTSRKISLFPNPANEACVISGVNNGDVITLFDITGRAIGTFTAGNSELEINISTLAPGCYLLRVADDAGNNLSAARLVIE